MAQHPSDQDGSPPGPAAGKRLARRRALVVHPLLFAAFPVLFLWAHNLQEGVTLGDAVRLLAMVIGGTAALWLLGALVLRSPSRSALAVSILVVMFFSYGYLYQGLSGVRVGGLRLGSNPILLPFWGALAAVGIVLAVRGGSWLGGLTQGLNVVAAGLVVLNVVSIVSFQVGPNASGAQFLEQSDVQLPARLLRHPPAHRPDIYYIVLDEYAGAEALLDDFHYDNSPFLDFLKNRGFAVPSDSLTNYPRTELSVASSLNLEYVNFLTQEAGPDTKDETPLIKMMQDNQVGTIMESLGYDYIQIGSYWLATSSSPIADEESPVKAYVDQLIYVDKQVERVLNVLLSRPVDQRPAIVIQADEGPPPGSPTAWSAHPPARTLEEKFALLNAYYLPGVSQTHLYPTITPVNSFRVVLNDYFNAGLPLLPDRAYTFKSLKNIYAFTDVTKLVQPLAAPPTPAASPP